MTGIEITDRPTPEQITRLEQGLADFMRSARPNDEDDRMLAVLEKDADGSIVAGLVGRTGWDQLFVDVLFVAEKERPRPRHETRARRGRRGARSRVPLCLAYDIEPGRQGLLRAAWISNLWRRGAA